MLVSLFILQLCVSFSMSVYRHSTATDAGDYQFVQCPLKFLVSLELGNLEKFLTLEFRAEI